jgi:glycosyltransferase involved in cell wall biosynthesis
VVEISVIIPTMNEETSIGAVLDEVRTALAGRDFEVLTVDTDSRDRTNAIATAKGARVVPEPRRGYGRAYKTGFIEARGTYVLTLDADLTYPADAFRELLAPLEAGTADFVAADRISRLSGPAMTGMHRIGNTMLNVAFRVLYRFPMHDSQSGMWAFRRDLLPRLHVVHDGMAFSEELKVEVLRRGFRYLEVPIDYRTRLGEKKIRSFTDAFENFFWLLRKRVGWIREETGSLG